MHRGQNKLLNYLFILFLYLTFIPNAFSKPLIIAHRGASGEAPENTMVAFKLAWELGADGIEGDFHLTRDGHIVAIHDKDTNKVTKGKNKLIVKKTSLKELQGLDVGSWKNETYSKARIPTLEDVIDSLPEGTKFFIEIKCGTEIMKPLIKVIDLKVKERPILKTNISFISFDKDVIKSCRTQWPDIEANYLESYKKIKGISKWAPNENEVFRLLKLSLASGIGTQANKEVLNPKFIKRLRQNQLSFHCWTINDIETARHFRDLGVDSITTDFPKRIRDGLK
ncbi:MAG: glycerophosphodiester phosphodiesterase [Verrucomicrobiota bacterium]|nr:glycerophosphodiester phosphodiesterase [Verrucomicrobiota bacterium]